MVEVVLGEMDPRRRRQFVKAQQAFGRRDFDYVMHVCRSLLEQDGRLLEVRRLLRSAQEAAFGGRHFRRNAFLRAQVFWLRLSSGGKSARLLIKVEAILTKNPRLEAGHRLLGDCATALGDFDTAAFAYEAWRELAPQKNAAHLALAGALLAAGRAEEAMRVGEGALARFPEDAGIRQLAKESAVAVSLERGAWGAEVDS